jgi:Ca2+-binding RTX toxin-like protein
VDELGVHMNIKGKNGRDNLSGTADADVIYGLGGADTVWGHDGNDLIYGGDGDDYLMGMSGNDELHGDAGRDTLQGQHGHDILYGGAGNDSLWGGTGGDTMRGGTGADIFNFGRSMDSTARTTEQVQAITGDTGDVAGIDKIMDFNRAEGDRIDVSRIDAFDYTRDGLNENASFTRFDGPSTAAGSAWIVNDLTQSGHATLYLNQDGGEAAEFQLEIYGSFTALTWADIII